MKYCYDCNCQKNRCKISMYYKINDKKENGLAFKSDGDDEQIQLAAVDGISYDNDDITEVVPNNQQKKQKIFNQESTQNNESKICEKFGYYVKLNAQKYKNRNKCLLLKKNLNCPNIF
ncbi:hypothetical protein BpHYR1_047195 [Brachionus plicatilis]|uniref:Uncharacterized protein n=1 Tax=Brachionus plicatilis TaxID=10195 RepID=A0A3M7P6B3_BRAPC|nr:hypothetical protein BpHYR1_047195 [Brachionus plicatilis]